MVLFGLGGLKGVSEISTIFETALARVRASASRECCKYQYYLSLHRLTRLTTSSHSPFSISNAAAAALSALPEHSRRHRDGGGRELLLDFRLQLGQASFGRSSMEVEEATAGPPAA